MPTIQQEASLGPRALGDDTENNQSIFQHIYFIIAVVVALVLVAARLYILRRRNRPISEFFTINGANPYSYGSRPEHGSSYQPRTGVPLAPMPAAYRPDRRVRAADTDAGGRRLGPDAEGDWEGKDALPAYDNIGGPPKYIEADWRNFGPLGAPQMPMEHTGSAPPVGAGESAAENNHDDDAPRTGTEQPHDSGLAGTLVLPPAAYHDSRSS
ncbi:hypothetical protein HYDPIDRAFT_40467 [Hydnomerulius pinastri MD-312]|uniref:Uncharacterized protein n=1 Tax=Hydnomerulius pinastri MD-312 TaxID=994086 RepID=A0A0C9VFG6_9AGAM|nr:hypothetical protein HYDPIDRAFT_40467 [Hydnomerulius pinastri MD-312]